jgi:hypothetical protein
MSPEADILERLCDFDNDGLTATARFNLRMDAYNEITQLRAEREAAAWQPIETVPKDGFEIDLWCRNIADGSGEVRFSEMFWNESGKWEDWRGYILEPKWKPTHWRRTPEGPSVIATEGNGRD